MDSDRAPVGRKARSAGPRSATPARGALLADLEARGLVHATTDAAALEEALAAGVTLYHGIDPTADSLHTGNLIGLVMLRRFLDHGHRPIALAGGATGMIGDPSGRSDERNLLEEATLRRNVEAIKGQMARILGEGDWQLVDNYEWTRDVTLLGFLRDVGKHAPVTQMLSRESVKQRMGGDEGISFTEFSYMLLQAYDYQHLFDTLGCTLQVGGSDQWGNILSGVDLIRRTRGAAVHALAWPLLTAPDGTKLGKTTGARVWLDPAKTSPYEFFQHWLRTEDAQVGQLLRWFTLLDVGEIDEILAEHERDPGRRGAQRALALAVTTLVHGDAEARRADDASATAFRATLGAAELEALEDRIPTTRLPRTALPLALTAALTQTALTGSKSEGTRLVKQGGVSVNQQRVEDPDRELSGSDIVADRWILLQVGKKNRHLVVVEDAELS